MAQIVPLNANRHAQYKIRPGINTPRLQGQHVLPLVVHEFVAAGSEIPVVFVQAAEEGQFLAVAMLGLDTGESLFMQNGQWSGPYLPQIVHCEPFKLLSTEQGGERLLLGIDEESAMVNEDEGEPVFNADGEATEFLTQRRDFLTSYLDQDQITKAFIAMLSELGLLGTQDLTIDINGEKSTIKGVYVVDEKKVGELSDEQILDLHKRGFMRAIHAHLMSLNKIRRLAKIKASLRATAQASPTG